MSIKRWRVAHPDSEAAARLTEECGIPPFLALLLTTRGISSLEEAEDFLVNEEIGDDPFAFADMELAVDRIQRAIDQGEKIAVYGDYDVDGVTSTVLLTAYLRRQGLEVAWYIPQREEEGYGLHEEPLRRLAADGVRLLITVDNGIVAREEVALAVSLGMDVVVTDHHQPSGELPQAAAVVDPHRPDCPSECKDYAGVGVVFKLVCALEGDADPVMEEYGDLVALGMLADVMSLRGEARRLVRQGLRVLHEKKRPGIAALARLADPSEKPMSASRVAFTLAPRLNAAGRMDHAEKAAQLLFTADKEEADRLAEEIQQLNVRRQEVEAQILAEMEEQLRCDPMQTAARILVLAGENWHPGVLGILAARMMERYGKPCIALTIQGDTAHGSGRSLPGFSLHGALSACREELTAFGGHELAAGMTLPAQRIPAFRERLNRYTRETAPEMPVPELAVDFRLRPAQIDREKLELLAALEPCGAGNPQPVFGLFQMQLDSITPLKGGKHLRLGVSRDGVRLQVMKFQTAPEEFPVPYGTRLNLAVTIEKNEYRGEITPTLIARDIRLAATDQEALLRDLADFAAVCRREPLPSGRIADPLDRELLGRIYRGLRASKGWKSSLELLRAAFGDPAPSYLQLRLALEVFREAGLITVEDTGDRLTVSLCPANGKADLEATPLMQYIRTGRETSAAAGRPVEELSDE